MRKGENKVDTILRYYRFLCVMLFASMFTSGQLLAKLDFANSGATFTINGGTSRLKLSKLGEIEGWSERSIIRENVTNNPSTWVPTYSDGMIIGYQSGDTSPSADLVLSNSNAINYGLKNNSNAIVKMQMIIRTTSHALLYCCKNTSHALIYGLKNNSNALSYGIKNNSNAIMLHDRMIRTHSNAFVYCCKNTSNALSYGLKNNSNALIYGIKNNSNAIMVHDLMIRTHSNALIYGIKNNSNAFVYCCKNTSNALIYGLKNNSNALVYGIKNNSNAIMLHDEMIRTHSNAFVYCCKNSSNALTYGLKNNSNAIVSLDGRVTQNEIDIAQNAADIAQNAINIALNSIAIKNNSNALLYCCKNTSNAFIYAIKNNSNALLYGIKNNSNAFAYCCRTSSNAIVAITQETDTIVGPMIFPCSEEEGKEYSEECNVFPGGSYTQVFDLWISQDDPVSVNCDTVWDGNGHFVQFARSNPGIITVANGVTLTFKDVVLKDFSDDIFNLGTGAKVIFADGVVIELADNEALSMDWDFRGNATVQGFGNRIDMGQLNILVKCDKTLILKDTCFYGVTGTNIRCLTDNSSITFQDACLCLSGDYTFGTGYLTFKKNVKVTGNSSFIYATDQLSTIESCSMLHIDKDATFRYAPVEVGRCYSIKDLLRMRDITSVLFFDGCLVEAADTGFRLAKGTLWVDHKVPVYSEGESADAGVTLGNGNSEEDLNIHVLPGASLDLQTGFLTYDNVD